MFKKFLILSLLLGPVAAFAQVSPSASGGTSALWVGGEFSNFNPDYGRSRLNGIGVFADYNLTPKLGAEGEARWLHWSGDGGETESNYLAGVKYRVYKWNRFGFNAKFLLGGIWITYPPNQPISSGSYFAYVPGGFVDYRISQRLSVRGDYEYQLIPSAPGKNPIFPSNGLTPNGFSVGVAYRLFGAR